MSVGGIFTIITNNGIQDKLIMNMDLLASRIKDIVGQRFNALRRDPKYVGKKDIDIMKATNDWIPRLVDIEKSHIVFVNATFKPYVSVAHEYSKTLPKGGQSVLGQSFGFTMPTIGEFVGDSVVHIRLSGFAAKAAANKVRYIEMLGHRIMKNTRFKLNGLTLDEYTADRYNINWQFKVQPGKETGYLRCIGQEQPKLGYLVADPTVDEVREYRYFGDGAQTFKTTQPTLDMWIPLLFWFKDVHSALPNFLFPHGQTDIEIDFETAANLIAYANYNGDPDPIYNPPVVSLCELYMNHIFIDPAIHKIFKKRFGFQLIRVTRTHTVNNLMKSDDSVFLQKIKWPVESLYVAFRPAANLTNSQRWHRNAAITTTSVKEAVVTGIATLQVNTATYYTETPVVSTIGLQSHGIVIYPPLPPEFYNSYIPTQYGAHLKTPRDMGWFMMNFNFHPGEFQPSGYLNTSVGRELYLDYTSAIDPDTSLPYIRSGNAIDLIVVADCINFLLTKNNAATLRFTT